MSEWFSKRLDEIIEFNPRETIKKGVIAKKIAMDKLQPFCRDITEFELAPFSGGAKFRNGDTIMARITPCLENGKTAKVNILDDGEIGFGSTEYIVFRAKERIDADFIYYLISSPLVREPAIKSMVGSSGRQRVQIDVLQNLTLMIPSFEEQNKIASILKVIDDKISLNRQINHNLEQQAYAYYLYLFVENANPAWKHGTISDLGKVVGGSTPPKAKSEYYTSHGIAWITPKDLSNNKSKFITHGENDITELGLKNSSASIMPKGTVLFSSRAPIGYIAIADGDVTTNQGFKSIVPVETIGTPYIYFFLKYNLPSLENQAIGSTFKEVSGAIMKAFEAVIPDVATLNEFNIFCNPIFEQQRKLEHENQALKALRDLLLPKLMSGEIDVSDIAL